MNKKFFLSCFLTVILAVISFAQTSDLFKITTSTSEDITGNITTYEMQIYNTGAVTENDSISTTIYSFKKKLFPDGTSANQFSVMYVGQSWNFFETIQIKIDDTLFNFSVEAPQRITRQGFVIEILNAELSQEFIKELNSCKSLIVQINGKYRGKPVTIDKNGMEAINSFFVIKN
jgi:hypothetical protein